MRALLCVASALLAGGCASAALRAELDRVEALGAGPLAVPDEVPASTSAQASALLSGPVSVDTAVRVAVLNNRELRAQLRELGVANAQVAAAGAVPNPRAEVVLFQSHATDRAVDLELGVEWDLKDAILAAYGGSAARDEREAARGRAAGAVLALGYEVRAAFFALRSAERRWQLAARALDGMTAARDMMRALDEAGNVTSLRRWTEEAAYEGARQRVADLQLEVLSRREALGLLMGLSGSELDWSAAPGGRPIPEALDVGPELERRALVASLPLRSARAHLDALATRAAGAHVAQWLPDLDLQFRAEQDGDDWRLGGGVVTSLPVFNLGAGASRALEAEAMAEAERYHGLALRVRSRFRGLRAQLLTAHARVQHVRTALLPARRRVAEESMRQYNAMQIDLFQLLVAGRELLDAQLSESSAIADYWTAQAALDALLAGALVDATLSSAAAADAPTSAPASAH